MNRPIKMLLGVLVVISTCNMFATEPTTARHANIRLYFTVDDTDERVVLERKREGARLPTRTDIEAFNSGYYDIALDRATTFAAIVFDDNKTPRIIPISMDEHVSSYAGHGKLDKTNYLYMRCDNIGSDGIGSAYVTHSFSVESNDKVSSYLWHFYLKNQHGEYVEVNGGDTTTTFEIAAITEPEQYAITNGCLDGVVECLYSVDNNQYYTILFPVMLELDSEDTAIDDVRATDTDKLIEVFTLQGIAVFRGAAAEYDQTSIPSGIYIRRETDHHTGITKTYKIIK